MKRLIFCICLFGIGVNSTLFSQNFSEEDTLDIPQVVVTANRDIREIKEVPGRIEIINSKQINELPAENVDDLLKHVANVYVNRSWGIFSKNSSVTMRGLDASARVLVLLDGVPLNKSAGGSINWSLVPKDQILRIEVLKGPASAIYGNNAMAGVINIITKKPEKKIQGEGMIQAGSYETFGANMNLSGNSVKDEKGLTWGFDGFFRNGKGYYLTPIPERDSTDVKAFLTEYSLNAMAGYQFSKNHKVELSARYYDDSRGQGRKVYEEYGDFVSLSTTFLNAKYSGSFGKSILKVHGFYQHENEFKQAESISTNSGKYKLSERVGLKNDIGLWINMTTYISNRNTLTYGIDVKSGNAQVKTTYFTSSDILNYEGVLDFYGFFIQDEIKFLNEKLILVAGARMDFSKYSKGKLVVENPTSNTGFITSGSQEYDDKSWSAFSPKLALKYNINDTKSLYVSYSQGFMPPKLDDLSKSGKINKGFKLANPELGPEYLTNYELGATLDFYDKMSFKPSVYLSDGRDFQYFVGTGDSVDTGGDELKPVYQRKNVSSVRILGFEISGNYNPIRQLSLAVNYSYNNSTISDFKADKQEKDLNGKFLIEVPEHMAYVGIDWHNKFFTTKLSYNYIGSQWYDDENTILIDAYQTIDLKLSKVFARNYFIGLTVQNILDNKYIDRKGYQAPGRFIISEIKYKF